MSDEERPPSDEAPSGDLPSDETPADAAPPPPEPATSPWAPRRADQAVTEGGYAYTVVDDSAPAKPAEKPRKVREPLRISPPMLAAAILVPAIIVGVAAWFAASMFDDDGSDNRADADVASLIQAFSSQNEGSTVQRFEGELAPGFPEDVPVYPDGRIVSSVVQVSQEDALYWAVYDTEARFDEVVGYFHEKFSEDPWQVDLGQDSGESSVRQFSRIDDPDVQGVVLVGASKDGEVTTIFQSINVVAGADDAPEREFDPGAARPLPEGFPEDLPQYPDGLVIETAFRREPRNDGFAISLVTRDDAGDVLGFYRDEFERLGWTVADADASQSQLPDAQAITFEAGEELQGNVTTSEFTEDENYTRIDVQVNSTR